MKLDILVDLINSTKFAGNPVGKLGGICKLVLKEVLVAGFCKFGRGTGRTK